MSRIPISCRPPGTFAALMFALLSLITVWAGPASHAAAQESPDRPSEEELRDRAAFTALLTSLVDKTNSFILKDRRKVLVTRQLVLNRLALTRGQRGQYRGISTRYGIPFTADPSLEAVDLLLQKVDTVPAQLVLERAAQVSNWGTSPRARQTENFYGLQCRRGVCKLQPDTSPGTPLSRFSSSLEATRAYAHLINTQPEFETFRVVRANTRAASGAKRS